MKSLLRLSLGICLVFVVSSSPVDDNKPAERSSDRTLFIRSLPGYPGSRSNLYEVYMEPYLFVSTYVFDYSLPFFFLLRKVYIKQASHFFYSLFSRENICFFNLFVSEHLIVCSFQCFIINSIQFELTIFYSIHR